MTNTSDKLASNTLDASAWTDVSALYDELSGLPAQSVETRLENAGLAPAAAELLRKMLSADKRQAVLDKSLDQVAEGLLELSLAPTRKMPADLIGRRFGAWSVTGELGEGGMGAVFLAERTDGRFEKTAALKLIKPGLYTDYTAQRFAEEMRTLARLEHPNIARLIDGGISEDDIPYFVMEYVDGEPITEFADRLRLSLAARVELLCQVCSAVEHAHRNLVVHGDLKPSNILVNEHGQVRLVDFGIARSLKSDLNVATLPRFTPQYAAPEQIRSANITTVSDVFGLCGVLYELCCGAAPRSETPATTVTNLRLSLNATTPPALQRFEESKRSRHIAACRQTTASRLRKSLRGDLAWILSRGLEVDPALRTESASVLRQDLRFWLDGYPIVARPASTSYRLRRWLGRYKLPVAIGMVAFAGLALTGVAIVEQTRVAQSEAAKASWSKQFLISIFEQADPALNERQPITVNELTENAARQLLAQTGKREPSLQLEAIAILAPIVRNLGLFQLAEDLTIQQLALARITGDARSIATALNAHGKSLTSLDKLVPAAELYAEALSLVRFHDELDPLALTAVQQRAMNLARVASLDEARSLVTQLLEREPLIAATEHGSEAMAFSYMTLAEIHLQSGTYDRGLEAVNHALHYARQLDENSLIYAKTLAKLSRIHYTRGDTEAAATVDRQILATYERLYGPDHPLSVRQKAALAFSLSQLGQMDQAQAMFDEVLANYRTTLGENNQFVAGILMDMGAAWRALGDYTRSADYYAQSLSVWEHVDSPPPGNVAGAHAGYARALTELGRYTEAERMFVLSLARFEPIVGVDSAPYRRAQCHYAALLIRTQRYTDAEAILPAAYDRLLSEHGPKSIRTATCGISLAELRSAQGDLASAREFAAAAIAILDVKGLRARHALEIGRARTVLELSR